MPSVKYNPNRFLNHWLLSALFIWPVVGIACLILWSPLALVFSLLGVYREYSLVSEISSVLSLLLVPSSVIGYFAGHFQSNLLHHELSWEIKDWQRQSLIGAICGAGLVILGSYFQLEDTELWVMPLFVLGLSSLQWLSLRHESRDAWLWILGNLAGGLVFSGLMFVNPPQALNAMNALGVILWWALSAAMQGLVTGIVMLYLYERPLQEDGRELAPVYIEVHNRNQR